MVLRGRLFLLLSELLLSPFLPCHIARDKMDFHLYFEDSGSSKVLPPPTDHTEEEKTKKGESECTDVEFAAGGSKPLFNSVGETGPLPCGVLELGGFHPSAPHPPGDRLGSSKWELHWCCSFVPPFPHIAHDKEKRRRKKREEGEGVEREEKKEGGGEREGGREPPGGGWEFCTGDAVEFGKSVPPRCSFASVEVTCLDHRIMS